MSVPPPLTLTGRDPRRSVTFPRGLLLAPMDGITDRTFRDLVIGLGHVGGACTEFVRVSVEPLPVRVFRRDLGTPPGRSVPVGVQIMAPDARHVAATVAAADAAGASFVDLNFGCPVKRVFNQCAGSALLAHPGRIGEIVAAAVSATGLPVTAKIRAGVEDDGPLRDVLAACVRAGAAGVTLHARLRRHSYAEPARWEWIARAVALLAGMPGPAGPVPLVGNGSIDRGADAGRMLAGTGCAAVMVGRAALADPYVFREACGGPPATRAEAGAFALRYLDALCPPGTRDAGGLNPFKRLVAAYRSGGLFEGREEERTALLRTRDPEVHRAWFREAAEELPVR